MLTIAGERLELARVLVLTNAVRRVFLSITGMVLIGLLIWLAAYDSGMRIAGLGLAMLGVWLVALRYRQAQSISRD